MPESQWLDHQGKRKNYLWLAILVVAVCVAAGIFIRNNSDVFGVSRRQMKDPVTAAPVPVVAEPEKNEPVLSIPAKAMARVPDPAAAPVESGKIPQQARAPQAPGKTPAPVQKLPPPQAPVPSANEVVPLEGLTCRLMDRSQPSIRLSLLLSFTENKALKQEILVKRDNLKVMVKKTLATKSMDDLIVDSLRNDLKSGLNSVLENGAITDIEFKEFRIEKVE